MQQGIVAGHNIAIFDGGWCQWQMDPDNPIETGVPEQYKEYDILGRKIIVDEE